MLVAHKRGAGRSAQAASFLTRKGAFARYSTKPVGAPTTMSTTIAQRKNAGMNNSAVHSGQFLPRQMVGTRNAATKPPSQHTGTMRKRKARCSGACVTARLASS